LTLLQHLQHRDLYALGVRQNVVVPKANDLPAATLEPEAAAPVVFIVRVLSAIGLDDEAMLDASEIGDEGPERMLTAEFVMLQQPPAQRRP
jgi:hypothetical protein